MVATARRHRRMKRLVLRLFMAPSGCPVNGYGKTAGFGIGVHGVVGLRSHAITQVRAGPQIMDRSMARATPAIGVVTIVGGTNGMVMMVDGVMAIGTTEIMMTIKFTYSQKTTRAA